MHLLAFLSALAARAFGQLS